MGQTTVRNQGSKGEAPEEHVEESLHGTRTPKEKQPKIRMDKTIKKN